MAQEKTITELYAFLQKHMVTKDELKEAKEDLEAKMATKGELKNLESKMATDLKKTELSLKDHIDDKLADLKGDLIVLMRKEDYKLLYYG